MMTFVLTIHAEGEGGATPLTLNEWHGQGTMTLLASHASGVAIPTIDIEGQARQPHELLCQAHIGRLQALQSAGETLYRAIAPGAIGDALAMLPTSSRVFLDIRSPALSAVPWELLWHGGRRLFMQSQPSWLRGSPESSAAPCRTNEPLRVLVLVGHAADDTMVQGHEELCHLEDELHRRRANLLVRVLVRPEPEEILRALEEFQPHVFHFIGHGGVRNGLGQLHVFSNHTAMNDEWDAQRIRDAFAGLEVPRLAFINACNSTLGLAAWDIANAFLDIGVPAVIAMQSEVQGEASRLLSRAFYSALAEGATIDQALSRARNRLNGSSNPTTRACWPLARLVVRGEVGAILPSLLDREPNTQPSVVASADFVARWAQRTVAWRTLCRLEHTNRLLLVHGTEGNGKSALALLVGEMWSRVQGGLVVYADLDTPGAKNMALVVERVCAGLANVGLDTGALGALSASQTSSALGFGLVQALETAAGGRSLLVILDGFKNWNGDVARAAMHALCRPFLMSGDQKVRLLVVVPTQMWRMLEGRDDYGTPVAVTEFKRDEWQRAAAQFIRYHEAGLDHEQRDWFRKRALMLAELSEDFEVEGVNSTFQADMLEDIRQQQRRAQQRVAP